jgi:AraC-like DNA-binding protein
MDDHKAVSIRYAEISNKYFAFLDKHIADLVAGKAIEMLNLNQIAGQLCISHKHLIAVIRQTSGNHPCYFYDFKILEVAKKLISNTSLPIAEIARRLTYDPSNFSKFFRKLEGMPPGLFRKKHSAV